MTITAVDDNDYNGDRQVTVSGSASNDVGVTDPDDVTLTITEDDDKPVSVSFDRQDSYTVVEGGGVTVKVTLSAAPERERPGTSDATEPGRSHDRRLQCPGQRDLRSIRHAEELHVHRHRRQTMDDDGESVELTFGSLPPGVSGGATTEATVTISDNDGPPGMPMVTLNVSPRVIEEQGGSRASTAIVTASLDRPSAADTMVTISTDPAAAERGSP